VRFSGESHGAVYRSYSWDTLLASIEKAAGSYREKNGQQSDTFIRG
jgi:hypothetical protein